MPIGVSTKDQNCARRTLSMATPAMPQGAKAPRLPVSFGQSRRRWRPAYPRQILTKNTPMKLYGALQVCKLWLISRRRANSQYLQPAQAGPALAAFQWTGTCPKRVCAAITAHRLAQKFPPPPHQAPRCHSHVRAARHAVNRASSAQTTRPRAQRPQCRAKCPKAREPGKQRQK